MYCLVADGYIYTMDHSKIKHLEHKQEDEDGKEERNELCPKVSADYFINDEAKSIYCHMISNIDDIMTILNNYQVADGDETHIVHRVHETNVFIELLTQLRDAGYRPGVTMDCGRIVSLILEFNKVVFIIKTQQ
mgnify:CR=1 FL=1